jgi:hypothetical protein
VSDPGELEQRVAVLEAQLSTLMLVLGEVEEEPHPLVAGFARFQAAANKREEERRIQ